jgi:acyl-CoA thioesterase
MKAPSQIVETMMANDLFSQWLGIQVLQTGEGFCSLSMTVRKEMLNGFGIAHGGITYCLADSALAFASNSHGLKSVSVETSISHLVKVEENDTLIAHAHEEHISNKVGVYTVEIVRASDDSMVALFKGTVYRTSREW